MKKLVAAVALLVAMTACGGAQKNAPLEGTMWKLSEMKGIPASAMEAESDFFTLQLRAADTMVSGRTNCNRFFGRYTVKDARLSFDQMGMTRMACPDMAYEEAFVKMLSEVDRYAVDGKELKLYGDDRHLATFTAVEAASDTPAAAAAAGTAPENGGNEAAASATSAASAAGAAE